MAIAKVLSWRPGQDSNLRHPLYEMAFMPRYMEMLEPSPTRGDYECELPVPIGVCGDLSAICGGKVGMISLARRYARSAKRTATKRAP